MKFGIHFNRSSYHSYIFSACIRYSEYLKYIQICGKTKGRQWLQRGNAACCSYYAPVDKIVKVLRSLQKKNVKLAWSPAQ